MFRLRRATLTDAPAIVRVEAQCWRESYDDILPESELARLGGAERVDYYARNAPEDIATWVITQRGAIVGFCQAGLTRTRYFADLGFYGEIFSLYLLRAVQGQGAGRAMVGAAVRHLQRWPLNTMALWCLRDNQPGRAFYRRIDGEEFADLPLSEALGGYRGVGVGWTDLSVLATFPEPARDWWRP